MNYVQVKNPKGTESSWWESVPLEYGQERLMEFESDTEALAYARERAKEINDRIFSKD